MRRFRMRGGRGLPRLGAVVAGAVLGIWIVAEFGAPETLLGKRDAEFQLSYVTDESWMLCSSRVAHGMGSLRGQAVTNSVEAFQENYRRGFRIFEVDLIESADGSLVAAHDRSALKIAQPERAHPRNTLLTSQGFVALAAAHPDAYFILDLKSDFRRGLTELVSEANAVNPQVLSRIIPQFYFESELSVAAGIYPFRSFIYTLYRTHATEDDVLRFVRRAGVAVVTMSESRFSQRLVDQLAAADVQVFVHTVNSEARAQWYHEHGVRGVYTDSLPPMPSSLNTRCRSR